MHVALLSPAWPLEIYPNGIVTYVHWLRLELLRRGHAVTVITGTLAPDCRDPGVEPIVTSVPFRTMAWVRARSPWMDSPIFSWGQAIARTLMQIHRRSPIDVVEMEESFGWFADVQRRTGLPVVVKLHGPAFLSLVEEELRTPLAKRKIALEGVALAKASTITSPSQNILDETVARYALANGSRRRVVNPLEFPENVPLWDLAGCDPSTLLFVGRFDQRKGGDTILRAFARLVVERPALKLIFVGPDAGIPGTNGVTVRFEEFKASLGLGDAASNISFLGRRTPAEILALRPRALCTVVASRWDNQSYTTLEAMLQGCPVVCVNSGGQGEIVSHGRTGRLAKSDDLDDLCTQLRWVLDHQLESAKLGAQAREYVRDQHGAATVAAQTLDVYREAIESRVAHKGEVARA